jgi:hypothetical protein
VTLGGSTVWSQSWTVGAGKQVRLSFDGKRNSKTMA